MSSLLGRSYNLHIHTHRHHIVIVIVIVGKVIQIHIHTHRHHIVIVIVIVIVGKVIHPTNTHTYRISLIGTSTFY